MGASQVEETSAQAQKLYTCEHCQVTFLRPVHLERHMRNVHSQEQESECKVCHKLFQNKYYLSVHMLTHAMDKELECPLCKKRFPDVDTLNKHKDAHLGISMKKAANVNNRPFTQGTNPQLNNQPGAGNVVHASVSTAGPAATTSAYSGAGRGNTFNCDLRRTDLNSLNRNARNYRSGQSAVPNVIRAPSNTNSTVSCDLRLGDINSLNQNATNSIRLPQKRPSNESSDVIVTGISSLKRPFRGQGLSGTNISRNQGLSAYGSTLVSTANKTTAAGLSQPSSRNSFLQNQFRNQNPMATSQHNASNNMTNRNVTDRIYLTSEGVSSQSTVRNSLPARISYSNRKQLANPNLAPNNRFGGNSIYSNLSHQRNQLLRNSNQTNQRSVVNCDLTRSNLGTINRRPGLPYRNTSQQFSNGTKELDSTVNCDLTISNISSLNKSQWPTNSNSVSRSAPVRNYGLSSRPVSTVNFDLTTADINVLKRDRRLQQSGRVLPPSTSTTGQTPNTLNCDLSMVNLSSIEKNRPSLNNGNRFGRLNANVMSNQNSQMVQNTVNCDLTTNNLNDWNRRNTICYRAPNQQSIPSRQNNRQPGRPPNSNLSNVNLSNLNQRAVNHLVAGQSTQQQVRPVQVYANTSHPAVLQRQKIAAALGNRSGNFGVQGSNNALRNRTFPRRMASVGQPASPMSGFNRSRMSRLIRQRKTLASSNIPVIDLDPDEDMSVVLKSTARPTNATNVVQFDLTGPEVNVTTYQNGVSSYSNKQPSGNLVDIVELDTSNNTMTSQPASNNANSVVEFDLSNTSIQAFSTGQNETSSTCTINLDTDDWASNSRNITTDNNASSSDVTLLEVRNLNKPAKESDQTVPDITLSNVRSLSNLQPTSADDRSAVSGITLVDIRSLSTSEIDANFQDDSEKSETNASSGSVPGNSSSVRRRSSRLRNSKDDDDDDADTMPAPSLILDNDVAVDLCSNDGDNAGASVISEDQSDDKVQLKEDYFTCKICLEQIHHLCNYISHLKSHDAKEFCKCYYCDSVFGNIQELVVHSVVHVGDLKKQCVFCREVLATREDPITHMTGCGEFQCIMFESGTRVKIEKSFQKEGDQQEETENVVQNQVDKTETTDQAAGIKVADQNQVDQDEKTDQAAGMKVADQNQVDQDEKTDQADGIKVADQNQVDQDEKTDQADGIKVADQNQVDQDKNTDQAAGIKVADQNQVDQDEKTDQADGIKVADQNQVDQDEKTEGVAHRENASLAQNQVDQTETTDQADGIKVADQDQVDKVEVKSKVSHCEKGEGVTSDEDMKSSVQSRGDLMDQDTPEKNQQTDKDEAEKVEGGIMEDKKEESDEADGDASVKTHTQEDTVPITNAELPDEKEADNSVTVNFDTEEAEKSNPGLKNSEKLNPCFHEAENMDSCLDRSEIIEPRLDDSETPEPRLNNSESPDSHLSNSEVLEPHCNDSEMTEPHLDGSETPEPHQEGSKTPGPHLDNSEMPEPHLDGSEMTQPYMDGSETTQAYMESSETMQPYMDGSETPQPYMDGSETPHPYMDSSETPQPYMDGSETPQPYMDGSETPQPYMDGSETPQPYMDGSETPQPYMDGSETPQPYMDGSETPQPYMDGSETPQPYMDGSETPQPYMDGSETPQPYMDDSETPQPYMDDSETLEPHLDNSETLEPHLDNSETLEPHLDNSETLEPHLDNSKTPEPHLDNSEMPQPHLDNSETPKPHLSNSETPEEDDWCKWERDMIRNSKLAGSVLTNSKIKIEKDLDGECQEEIKFEVNLNKVKTEIDSTQETLEES